MEAKELRIGNIVNGHYRDGIKIIEIVFIDGIDGAIKAKGNPFWGSLDGITGIPLTPELLVKAGFDKSKFSYTEYKKWIGEDGFSLKWKVDERGNIDFILHGNGGYDDPGEMDIKNTCKYVHQLQNLYFYLSGEELEINL